MHKLFVAIVSTAIVLLGAFAQEADATTKLPNVVDAQARRSSLVKKAGCKMRWRCPKGQYWVDGQCFSCAEKGWHEREDNKWIVEQGSRVPKKKLICMCCIFHTCQKYE
jgi:hypothetical protein